MSFFLKIKDAFDKFKCRFVSKVDSVGLKITAIEVVVSFVLFLGLLIPVQVISMAPAQFVIQDYNPLNVVLSSLLVYGIVGILFIGIFFIVRKEDIKRKLLNVYAFLLIYLVIYYFIYGTANGILNMLLAYDENVWERDYDYVDNIKTIIIILFAIFITYVVSYAERLRKDIFSIVLVATILFSAIKIFTISGPVNKSINSFKNTKQYTEDEIKPIYNFSTNKRNVVVFMVDRFTGKYFEQIIKNFPDLKKKFTGFTFYNNTLSFGPQTTTGTPGLFGGYDYIPNESDKITDRLVVDKHNEALTLMPKMFGENGFDVVISNLPDANYYDPTRPSPYIGLKNVRYLSYAGRIKNEDTDDNVKNIIKTQKNHFIQYSFMMFLPVFLRNFVYNDGNYLLAFGGYGCTLAFLKFYVLFQNMNKMTSATRTKNNQAIIINNALTHDGYMLSYPDFKLTHKEEEFANESKISIISTSSDVEFYNRWEKILNNYPYYNSCVRATIDIGNWLDYLRKLKVYDNTRIIIVADHGLNDNGEKKLTNISNFSGAKYKHSSDTLWFGTIGYNPVLLYKDFNKKGDLQISDKFMTNADTPYLAMNGLIKNMVNPYNGKKISNQYKNRKTLYPAYITSPWEPIYHIDEYRYETLDRIFLSFKGKDVFDAEAWDVIVGYDSNICEIHENLVKNKKTEKETCGENIIVDYYECQDCKLCFYDEEATDRIYDMTTIKINIPHKFTNYIKNNDETETIHGTMTAKCDYGCGTTDTKGDPDVKVHQYNYIKIENKLPTFDNDGYEGRACDYCGKELGGEVIPKLQEPELEYTKIAFDGNKKEPKVTIKDGYGNIIDKDKYRLKYRNNKNKGTAEVDITMRKPYDGTTTVYFEIN